MRTSFSLVLFLFSPIIAASAGCGSSGASSPAGSLPADPGQSCTLTITDAKGANNALQSMQGVAAGDWNALAGLAVVCTTLPQAFQLTLTGASPKVGALYTVSTDPSASGNLAAVKYGESTTSASGTSTHVTWRGTAGAVTITATAKNSVSFAFADLDMEVDPDSNQNLATGTMILSGSGEVSDLDGFTP